MYCYLSKRNRPNEFRDWGILALTLQLAARAIGGKNNTTKVAGIATKIYAADERLKCPLVTRAEKADVTDRRYRDYDSSRQAPH